MTIKQLQKLLINFVTEHKGIFSKVSNVRIKKYDGYEVDNEDSFYVIADVDDQIGNSIKTKEFFVVHPRKERNNFYIQHEGLGGFIWSYDDHHYISEPLNEELKKFNVLAETINGDGCYETTEL
jgi:hypothetical protein